MDKPKELKKIFEIPKQYLEMIEEEHKQQISLSDNFIELTLNILKVEEQLQKDKEIQKKLRIKIVILNNAIKKIVNRAFEKLGLPKLPQYKWELTGNTFIGTLKTPVTKP